jgi:hypothetical protein
MWNLIVDTTCLGIYGYIWEMTVRYLWNLYPRQLLLAHPSSNEIESSIDVPLTMSRPRLKTS